MGLHAAGIRAQEPYGILFYNTENFFDPYDDSLTRDESFTPAGEKHWTFSRFRRKAVAVYKVILAAGETAGMTAPELVGLAEVENGYVLHYLLEETPFSVLGYRAVHYESPDPRGIDVALLYDPARVRVLFSRPLRVVLPHDTSFATRDILFARIRMAQGDTLQLFVCHWPSRYGGAAATAGRRRAAAAVIAAVLDTLPPAAVRRQVIVMGDLNDERKDLSVDLLTRPPYRLSDLLEEEEKKGRGSLFYDGRWWMFDHFLVGEELRRRVVEAHVLRMPFLFDPGHPERPWRTYTGPRYVGGFSDHLPVMLLLRQP